MSDPKLQIEITGEAAGLYAVIAKVEEKLKAIQASGDTGAEAARKSMGALEQGARAAAQALKVAEGELAAIRSKLASAGGSGPDPAAALARVQAAQVVYARMQAQQLAAEQTLGQQRVLTYLRSAQATDTATRSLQSHSQAVQQAGHAHHGMAGEVFQAGAALMALRTALQSVQRVMEDMLAANLALEKAQRTLQMATGDGARGMAFIRGLARDLGLELVQTADGYAMMAAASKGTSMEGKATEEVFRSVARASAALSLSGDQTHGVILALSQMMSKGKVMAEEMRKQLGEHLPGAFNIAARAMGVSNAELDKMLRNGEVIASDFLPKFARELDLTLGDAPERAANSLQANINRMKTAFQGLSYEIGQGGAGESLSRALGEIAKAMDSPEGLLAAREMSRTLGDAITAASRLATTLWNLRGPILALAEAWVAVKVAQIVKGLYDWGAAKVVLAQQALAAREAIIQEALATQGLTLAKNQDAAAEVKKALAMLASQKATFANAEAMGTLTVAETAAAREAIALSEAKLAEAAAMTSAGAAGKLASGALAAFGGLPGLLIAGIGGLAFALSQYESASLKAAKAEGDRLALAARDRQQSQGLIEDAERLNKALNDNAATTDQKRRAQDQLQTVIKQLVAIYPEFNDHLKKEGDLYIWSAEGVRAHTEQKLKDAQATAAQAEATIKEAKAEIELAKAHAEAMVARNPEAGLAARGLQAAVSSQVERLTLLQENYKQALGEVQGFQKQLDALLNPPKDPKRDAPGGDAGIGAENDRLITQIEIESRLAGIRASSDERHTLEQQKQAALDRADKEYLDEKARLLREASSEEGLWYGKQEQLNQVWEANEQRRVDKRQAIERDYANKRQGLEADLQARLTAAEEGGLTKREERVRQFVEKLRQENEKLVQNGKRPFTDEQIQSAAAAERERLRVAQIRTDLGTLKRELSDLEKIKGGPLTEGEMAAAIDQFAKKSREAAAAAAILRKELHLNETAHQGWSAGVRVYIAESENKYRNFSNYAHQMLTGIENAWANTINGILTGQIRGGQILKSVWQGTLGVVAQVISQMIAKWLVLQIAGAALAKSQAGQSAAITSASLTAAAAETWEAYAWIPFLGEGLALAQIAVMETSVAAAGLGGAFKAFAGGSLAEGGEEVGTATVNATGGYYTRPTWGLFAEAGNELTVPEVSFKDYSINLARNILAQERQAQAYGRQAAGYAASVPGGRAPGVMHVENHYHQNAPNWDPSERAKEQAGKFFDESMRVHARRTGQVIDTSQTFGARF